MGLLMNMISVNVTMGNRTFLLSQYRNSTDASITNVLPSRTPDSQQEADRGEEGEDRQRPSQPPPL